MSSNSDSFPDSLSESLHHTYPLFAKTSPDFSDDEFPAAFSLLSSSLLANLLITELLFLLNGDDLSFLTFFSGDTTTSSSSSSREISFAVSVVSVDTEKEKAKLQDRHYMQAVLFDQCFFVKNVIVINSLLLY
ncbi:expressed protein [Arabidopsis lyrata subsp. lyrata]|uniref:Expressed protein n=1 Tax=Arabidopsis lyrata subsp. lyrata TaxID=81972 RepID=D7LGU0_ARALL|nr:expressed protein [Arabidopsis lyrata subsp. lyrata]